VIGRPSLHRPEESGIVGRIFDLAEAVRRLSPPDRRDPELRRVAHDAQRVRLG
jgi:hypothetical protein